MGQALRGQRQDHLVDAAQPALPLLDQYRLERAGPVAENGDLHRSGLGDHGLGPVAVAVVLPAALDPLTVLVTEMTGQLSFESRLRTRFVSCCSSPPSPVSFNPPA